MNFDYENAPLIPCSICNSKSNKTIAYRADSGRIVQCLECGHLFLNPTIADDALDTFYKTYYPTSEDGPFLAMTEQWFNDPQGPYQYVLGFLTRQVDLHQKKVLEIGCGTGKFLYECRKRGAFVTGIDINQHAARIAETHYHLKVITKTLEQSIIDGEVLHSSFDYIFAFETIEHIKNIGGFLQNLYALLSPNGILFVSTPDFSVYYRIGNAASVMQSWPEHVCFFTPQSLKSSLERYRFDTIEIAGTSHVACADLLKRKFMYNSLIRNIWLLLKHFRIFYYFKNKIFASINKVATSTDNKGLTTINLVAIARKI